jgi:creatinine amidohydrolase
MLDKCKSHRVLLRMFLFGVSLALANSFIPGCGRPLDEGAAAQQTETAPASGFVNTERRWEKIYGNAVYRLLEERPLVWMPLGIIERHGEQLPWGLDGDKAHLVCLRLADRLGGVVLPANQMAGVHGDRRPDQDEQEFRRFHREVGDLMFTGDYFRRFLWEAFDGLANFGFEVIVAYTGHYPEIQTVILKEVAEEYTATGRAVVIPFWEVLACGEGDHAAKWECSIWMALVPGGVRMDAIVDYKTGKSGYYRGAEIRSQISKEFGEKALVMIEKYLTEKVEEAFEN